MSRFTEHFDADLIVTGAASRSFVKRLLVGSTAERVLEKLPCDILVIKAGENVKRFVEAICSTGETVTR